MLSEEEALRMDSAIRLAGNAEETAGSATGDSEESTDTIPDEEEDDDGDAPNVDSEESAATASGEEEDDDGDAPTVDSRGESVVSVAEVSSVVDAAAKDGSEDRGESVGSELRVGSKG